jgi:hypothetical protein
MVVFNISYKWSRIFAHAYSRLFDYGSEATTRVAATQTSAVERQKHAR